MTFRFMPENQAQKLKCTVKYFEEFVEYSTSTQLVVYITRCCLQTDQGIKNLTLARATEFAGTKPDYATRDLYNAIARRQFPSWTFYIQVMTFEQAERFRWNPFDVTKVIYLW